MYPQLIEQQGVTAEDLHRAGVEALLEQRLEDAVLALRRAVVMDPSMENAWNDLGVVMEALGNPHEAVQCYRQALALQSCQSDAGANLGMLLTQMQMMQSLSRQAFTSSVAY